MQTLFFASLIAIGAVSVEVRPLDGPSVHGVLDEVTPEAVTIRTGDNAQRFDVASLWELSAEQVAKPGERSTTVWIELIDGSLIHADQYTVAAGLASVRASGGRTLSIRTALIHAVRFRDYASAPAVADLWRQIGGAKPTGDSLVVRRGERLDQLTGVIRNVLDDVVEFESDGEVVQAKRAKLEGLVYYHPAAGELTTRAALVVEASGTQWNARTVRTVDGQLELVTVAGVRAAVPLTEWSRIDFSSGNICWLETCEPEATRWQPFFDSRLPAALLGRLFGPRSASSPGGQPLMLGGRAFDHGLRLHSRTELVYRLTGDFRRFQALVGIDDRVRPAGNVALVISGDDRELYNATIAGTDEPTELALDITGVKRLKILVDFGARLDIADCLDLCEARITK